MSETANLDIVLGIYDAFRRGDIANILNTLDPQAELQFEGASAIPWSGNRRGREGWGEFFRIVGENLDDITLAMDPVAVQGEKVVAAGRYRARVKSTGKRIDSPLVHIWTIRDGAVVHCVEMTNTVAEAAACS